MENTLMEFTPDQVVAQVQAIQHLMRDVMKEGEHFGKIPGCGNKDALFKAGAEKLCFMFQLAPKFVIEEKDLGSGHREYRIICELYRIKTGEFVGSGMGMCSTMESKYRYRNDHAADVMLDIQVPKEYWDRKKDTRKPATGPELQEILTRQVGEPGRYGTKKDPNDMWVIIRRGESNGEKVENPDIADVYNTVLKMGKKRAQVDATLTATAASDIFTQDIEELLPDIQEARVVKEAEAETAIQTGDQERVWVQEQLLSITTTAELSRFKEACKEKGGWYWSHAYNLCPIKHTELNATKPQPIENVATKA